MPWKKHAVADHFVWCTSCLWLILSVLKLSFFIINVWKGSEVGVKKSLEGHPPRYVAGDKPYRLDLVRIPGYRRIQDPSF